MLSRTHSANCLFIYLLLIASGGGGFQSKKFIGRTATRGICKEPYIVGSLDLQLPQSTACDV